MTESGLPTYLDRGGEQSFRPPILGRGVDLHGFMFEANADALQALCDRYLNGPSRGAVRYVPLVPRVLLIFAQFRRLGSAELPDSQKGIMREIDVAFWVPVAAVDPSGAESRARRLSWFIPYIFVDHPIALITGREVYGYPKEQGTFRIPPNLQGEATYLVDTYGVEQLGPDAELTLHRLLEVRRTDHPALSGLHKVWDDLKDAFEDSMRLIVGGDGQVTLESVKLLVDVFEYLVHDEVPTVFLKQFRDAEAPDRACYQAVIEAPSSVLAFRKAGLLLGDYQLTVSPLATHPIVQDLGLTGPVQRAVAAWYADFDFVLGKGQPA